MLEFLDSEFQKLRQERDTLVDRYYRAYKLKKDNDIPFDSARLLGFLEAARPDGLSWRKARNERKPFPLHIEASCVDALTTLKINTPQKLRAALARKDVKAQLRRFAEIASLDPSEISHLAIILLVVLTLAPTRLTDLFPSEVSNSSELREMRRVD